MPHHSNHQINTNKIIISTVNQSDCVSTPPSQLVIINLRKGWVWTRNDSTTPRGTAIWTCYARRHAGIAMRRTKMAWRQLWLRPTGATWTRSDFWSVEGKSLTVIVTISNQIKRYRDKRWSQQMPFLLVQREKTWIEVSMLLFIQIWYDNYNGDRSRDQFRDQAEVKSAPMFFQLNASVSELYL